MRRPYEKRLFSGYVRKPSSVARDTRIRPKPFKRLQIPRRARNPKRLKADVEGEKIMCFLLYAGTESPLPRKSRDKTAPDLCVESLTEHDRAIRSHFTKPEVQYVGSTSGCGCDFPFVMLHNGEWPIVEDDEDDPEWAAMLSRNREGLVALLRNAGEKSVELYGVWEGDFEEEPKARESIALERILDGDFWFKERGFYVVEI